MAEADGKVTVRVAYPSAELCRCPLPALISRPVEGWTLTRS